MNDAQDKDKSLAGLLTTLVFMAEFLLITGYQIWNKHIYP